MAYTYQQIIDAVKREARAGVTGDYSEQYTVDILEYLNRVCNDIWDMHDWDFSKTPISVTLAAGATSEQSLAATIGEIIDLGVQGQTGSLHSASEKEYRKYQKLANATDVGTVRGYVKRGLDSDGNIKLLFYDPPTSQTVIEGEGKTRFSKITLADVQAATAIPYFPDKMVTLITEWAAGIFMGAINDPRGPVFADRAEKKVRQRIPAASSDPGDDATTPPPDLVRYNARNRGGTRVV